MIDYFYSDDEYTMLGAENQTWDADTLKQLKEEFNVIFMSNGDGVRPIMALREKENTLLVIGYEDDGTIIFNKKYGYYKDVILSYWVDSFIADLKEAKKFSETY